MNSNRIETSGFSNPKTERLFQEYWSPQRILQERADLETCAFCFFGWRLSKARDGVWFLCLHPGSPFRHETLCGSFSCPSQEHGVTVSCRAEAAFDP